jgi:hypothetical protein
MEKSFQFIIFLNNIIKINIHKMMNISLFATDEYSIYWKEKIYIIEHIEKKLGPREAIEQKSIKIIKLMTLFF